MKIFRAIATVALCVAFVASAAFIAVASSGGGSSATSAAKHQYKPPCPSHGFDDHHGDWGGSHHSSADGVSYTLATYTTSGGSHHGGGDHHGHPNHCPPNPCKASSSSKTSGSHSSSPCKPPTTSCTGASYVKSTSATLKGTVNPNGLATTVYFEYSKYSNFSSSTKTAVQSVGSGTSAKSISANITGLKSGTKYYCRTVAKNDKGTTVGGSSSFTTLKGKPHCFTGGWSNVKSTSSSVNGTVNPNAGSTSGYFEYGRTQNFGSKTSAQSLGNGTDDKPLARSLSGLLKNTKYYYRVVATNSNGTTSGSTLGFTTAR